MDPKNHRNWYKTEGGWKQAISQYESFNKERTVKEAKHLYHYHTKNIHNTGIDSQTIEPGILWES